MGQVIRTMSNKIKDYSTCSSVPIFVDLDGTLLKTDILIETLFIGFVAMLTLAGGLAFGLGGKDVVRELLETLKKIEIKEYKKEHHIRAKRVKK